MKGKSGVAAEIMTALPRSDGGAIEPGLAPLSTNLSLGTLAYSVPLEIPPGRVEGELSLALTYELRAHGNGPFGAGWSVSQLAVERRVDRGIPKFDASDTFALTDGTKLGCIGPSEYRPLVEHTFRRIRFVGSHWEVVETDGTRLLLGETEESRVYDPVHPERVAQWLLARREDSNGNVVRFHYERDLTVKRPEGYPAAQLYLRQIEYTNRGAANYLNVVRFDYDLARPEAWTSFRFGFPVRTNRICRQIVAFTSNLDEATARVINFGGVPYDASAHDGDPEDRYIAYGFYLISDSHRLALTLEFPLPLSGVHLRLDTHGVGALDGGRYQIEETSLTGVSAVRYEVSGAIAHEIVLGNDIRRVTVTALEGRLVLREAEIPIARLPEVYSGYRLGYRQTILETPQVDLANIAPPVKLLESIQRFGFDDTFAESTLPPVRIGYRQLSLSGVFPRPLRGTPSEPLGPTTTMLSFFGTGRPDMFQTVETHRVFVNHGRVGTDIVVEGCNLADSPSVKLGEADVFLRDVDGRGAADLTTTSYYYRNPGGLGTVSRTNPAWGARIDFDPQRRHPQLSPTELLITRAIDLNLDGKIDLLATESGLVEWENEGGGKWSPARRIPRRPSFGERTFPDVSFDDARIFIADMNGDGLDEIVRVSARKVEYWCRSINGWNTLKSTMAAAPRLGEFDPRRVVLVDVTGNGSADLLYLHGNFVELFVNCGGNRFAPPLRLDFTDVGVTRGIPMPSSTDAMIVVDLLGEGTRGLLWSFPRTDTEPNYFFLPLASSGKPFILSWVENGTGGRVDIEYTTSSILSAEDEANGMPWHEEPPYPVTVMAEIREIDQITGAQVVRQFRYRDGYFDRTDRDFRGFARVEERILGTSARRGLKVTHEFASSKPTAETPLERARARALAGNELRTTRADLATGATLNEIIRQIDLQMVRAWQQDAGGAWIAGPPLTMQPDGEFIAFAYEQRRLDTAIEGTTAPRYALREWTRTVKPQAEIVIEEFGRLMAETRYGEVVTTGTNPILATFDIDGVIISLRSADPARQRRTEYQYATNRLDHIVQYLSHEVVLGGAAFDVLLSERRIYYDGGTAMNDHLPLGSILQGNLQREEVFCGHVAEWEALFGAPIVARLGGDEATGFGYFARGTSTVGQQAFFSVDRRRVFAQVAGRIQFGAILQEWNARGATKTHQLDAATWYLRREQNDLGHATVYERISYRAGKPVLIRRENDALAVIQYDAFGREVSVTENAAVVADPLRITDYDSQAFVSNGGPTSTTVRRLIDRTENPKRYATEIRYLDGWGRVLQDRISSESHGGDYRVIFNRYEAGGSQPIFQSNPYWSAGSAYVPPGASQPGLLWSRDALMRVVEIIFPDGAVAHLTYAPWEVIVADPEDLDPASSVTGTPTLVRYDHSLRPVEVQITIRHGDGPGSEAAATTLYSYDAVDRLLRVVDARNSVTEFVYNGRGDVLLVRHPDAGETRRLYAADGLMVYERDAVSNEWWYVFDSLGRVQKEVPGADPTAHARLTYAYDTPVPLGRGQLAEIQDVVRNDVTRFSYDELRQVTRMERILSGAAVSDDRATYNDLSEIKRQNFQDGTALEYNYGLDGRVRAIRFKRVDGTAVPLVEQVIYHASTRVETARLSGGAVLYAASYDAYTQRLASRSFISAAGAVLFRLDQLVYDRIGNLRSYREQSPPAAAVDWVLEYDSLYRLRHALSIQGGLPILDAEYRYDPVGNFTRNDEFAPAATLTYSAALPNAVRGTIANPNLFAYDGDGRATRGPQHPIIRWNHRKQMDRARDAAGEQLDLLYTHDGTLVQLDQTNTAGVTSTLRFFSDQHEEHNGQQRYFATLEGVQWVSVGSDGTRTVFARSLANSLVRIIDEAGAPMTGTDEAFGPFGITLGGAPTAPATRGFANAIRGVGGAYIMGARPYLVGVGRFLAPDPVFLTHVAEEILFNPQRLSPYAYALNNPRGYVDPLGMQPTDEGVCWAWDIVEMKLIEPSPKPLFMKAEQQYPKASPELRFALYRGFGIELGFSNQTLRMRFGLGTSLGSGVEVQPAPRDETSIRVFASGSAQLGPVGFNRQVASGATLRGGEWQLGTTFSGSEGLRLPYKYVDLTGSGTAAVLGSAGKVGLELVLSLRDMMRWNQMAEDLLRYGRERP